MRTHPPRTRGRHASALLAALPATLLALSLAAGCSTAGSAVATKPAQGGRIAAVAAENFWGSILTQVGGDRVAVTTVIKDPNADPHEYEPTPADGRAVAGARYVLVNGAGYDAWADKLVAANPDPSRRVLNVGAVTHVPAGGNPHRWYSPDDVATVVRTISADLSALDPAGASYYQRQRDAYLGTGLARYHALIAQIRQTYGGVPIGASESIVAPLAQALGLNLATPAGFLDAVSEGSDPTARDKTTADQQLTGHQVKVFVYNSQNATPDVTTLAREAKAAGIPVTTVTETLTPPGASFQDWQTRQLDQLRAALATATGR